MLDLTLLYGCPTMKVAAFGGAIFAMYSAGCITESSSVDLRGTDLEPLDHSHAVLPNNVPIFNGAGVATTVNSTGSTDLTNEFFQDLGTNGRRCVTCHL